MDPAVAPVHDALARWLPELAIAAALAWGAGIRLYAVLLLVGLAGAMGWTALPSHLAPLSHPLVMGASGFMAIVELLADKVPWMDSLWDAIHTLIRIPAGAALAAAAFGDSGAAVTLAAAILGGTLAAGTHLTKAGTRGVANTSPEPFSNWLLSFAEDLLVPAGLWLAVAKPAIFLALLGIGAIASFLLLRWTAKGLSALWRRMRPA